MGISLASPAINTLIIRLIGSIKILKIDFTKLFKKKNKFKIGD